MVERSSALADHETHQPPAVFKVSSAKYAATLSVLLPFLSSCHAPTSSSEEQRSPIVEQKKSNPAPLLSSFAPGTNLLGKKFKITEDGPEALLLIENGVLIFALNGERLVVQKISTYEPDASGTMQRTDLELTPLKIAACSLIASLEAGENEVIGRISQFMAKPIEHHLKPEHMLPLANEIQNREHPEDTHLAEWKGPNGIVQGSATLTPLKPAQRMALR